MDPKIENGILMIDLGEGWNTEWRPAAPHEIAPTLVKMVEALQARVKELENWRENSR